MTLSLRWRFAALIGGVLLLALFALSWVLYSQGRILTGEMTALGAETLARAAEQQQRQRAILLSDFLAPTLVSPVYYADFDAARKLIETALKQPDVLYAVVFDRDGKLVFDGSVIVERFGEPMSDAGAEVARAATERVVQILGDRVEVVTPLLVGAERIGGLRLAISLTPARVLAHTQRDKLSAASALNLSARTLKALPLLALLAAVAALIASFIAHGLVAPILKLRSYARAVQTGDYQVRTESARSDEVGDLMRSFDAMADAVRRQHEEITQLAFSDGLTGLPNRNRVKAVLQAHLDADVSTGGGVASMPTNADASRAKPLAILLFDLDDFKRINDSLGHDAGDQLIKQLGVRLSHWVDSTVEQFDRPRAPPDPSKAASTVHVARFGGDEFLLLIDSMHARGLAVALADACLRGCAEAFVLPGERQVFVSPSIGVALYPADGSSVDALLRNADVAMYQAKRAGKNTCNFFASAMTDEVSTRLNLEGELRLALARQQLSLVYQPLIDLQSNTMVGAEALMRWNHPELGEVPPSIFIPLAEDTDLIASLGEWALEQASARLSDWANRLAPNFYLTVNVSVRQIRRQDMAAVVAGVLSRFPKARGHLNLEITESSLFENSVHAKGVMERLKSQGVGMWLDDFGTGFSGLSQLRRLPVRGVKIDQSFIADMATDPEDLAITQAIIAMAHSMGMKVTAEGVETQEQAQLLRARGCDTAQGYLFDRPLIQLEFERRLGAL
jgi:predicted signal transduction protein with EAL and GGDEF domain